MNRPHRSIEIFTMSALDLFITAMGSFAILMMILFPYYKDDRKKREEKNQGNVLVSAYPTRVKEYEQFKKETEPPGKQVIKPEDRAHVYDEDSWRDPGYEQTPDFPVVMVTWADAQAFCKWLTKKERDAGKIGAEDEYRLPTKEEWLAALGPDKYPWGNNWPPPPKFGNFGGEEYSRGRGFSGAPESMKGYEDDHELASPVGSYAASRDGLYDVLGNIRIWLQDEADGKVDGKDTKGHYYTGVGWDTNTKDAFERTKVNFGAPMVRYQAVGFRCVLVIKSPTAKL